MSNFNVPVMAMAVKTLVQRSQALGSTDDITAMLIQVEEIWELKI